jgi:hypothetical protein
LRAPRGKARIAPGVSTDSPVGSLDERLDWLAAVVPDPAQPLPEEAAAELVAQGRAVADMLGELVEADRVDDAAWAVARLRGFWLVGGNIAEGRAWADRVVACEGASAAARARVLETAATLAFEQGDEASARELFARSVETARAAQDQISEAASLGGLARCELMAGNLDAARTSARRCEAIHGARGDETARTFPLHVLAYADYIAGDDDAARRGFHVTLGMARERGILWRQAQELTNLCSVETRAGNLDEAEALGRESLELAVQLEHALLLPYCVVNIAGVASARGRHKLAARLLGAGDGLLAARSMELNPGTAIEYRRHRARAEKELGADEFRHHYDAGRGLGPDEAIAAARLG